MAIYHLTLKHISAGRGQSAVAAIAYRRGAVIVNEATGECKDFSRKDHIVHTEFATPPNAPRWITALGHLPDPLPSQKFWSQVEHQNTRLNAHYADEIELALPREFSLKENVDLVRAFVAGQLSARGLLADWAYHDIPNNPHVHILVQTRPLTDTGFGRVVEPNRDQDGSVHRQANGKIDYKRFGLGKKDLIPIRAAWAETLNRHYAQHGLDIRMDHRAFKAQGFTLLPSSHIGISAKAIQKQGGHAERIAVNRVTTRSNEQKVLENPELILDKLGAQQSVFTEKDIAAEIFRYTESRAAYQLVKQRIGASDKLIVLRAPIYDCVSNTEIQPAIYTTQSVFETEYHLLDAARKLARNTTFQVPEKRLGQVERAFQSQAGFALSDEQRAVLRHATGTDALAAIVGFAGAGKSSITRVIRKAYQANGSRVFGAALAGVAVDELKHASGIDSRTVCSWIFNWTQGKRLLKPGDVFVLDEAGMVSSQEMLSIIDHVRTAKAKLILIGDPRQLQPIRSGAAFRGIAEELGYRELTGIKRQQDRRHRRASLLLARGKTKAALTLHHQLGNLTYAATNSTAQEALIQTWKDYLRQGQDALILCHRNSDVACLNARARAALKAQGALQNEFKILTSKGLKPFAIGDRIVCLEGDPKTGLRNGTNACITAYHPATGLMTLTTAHGGEVQLCVRRYNGFDHGYAQTIHKSQGRTVSHALVYLSKSMDAQLTYVALTRHRLSLQLYAARQEFGDQEQMLKSLSRDRLKAVSFQHAQSQDYGDALWAFMQRRNIGTDNDWRLAFQKIIALWKSRLRLAARRLTALQEKLHSQIDRHVLSAPKKILSQRDYPAQSQPEFGNGAVTAAKLDPPMSDAVSQGMTDMKQTVDDSDRVNRKAAEFSLSRTGRTIVDRGAQPFGTGSVQNQAAPAPLIPALIFDESVGAVACRLLAQNADLKQIEALIRHSLARCFCNAASVADLLIDHLRTHATLAPHQDGLERHPADYGALLGKTSLFGAPNRQRVLAQTALRTAVSALEDYASRVAQLNERFIQSELAFREKMQQPLADLSADAGDFLARARDENTDLVVLGSAKRRKQADNEIAAFLTQIRARFGESLEVNGNDRFRRVAARLDARMAERMTARMKDAQSFERRLVWQSRALNLQQQHCQQIAGGQEIDL
ncbi:Ti-type conjugative transfer relaxase TraA [Brucella pseudogrignonensis]